MSNENEDRFSEKKLAYVIGRDFSKDEYNLWKNEIALWISHSQVNEENPLEKAERVLAAAINGTTIAGSTWKGVESYSLDKRILQLCNWDIINKTGRQRGKPNQSVRKKNKEDREISKGILEKSRLIDLAKESDKFKKTLYKEFPFLENPVYDPNINALCDASVKLNATSDDFLAASGNSLSNLLKVRESLQKEVDMQMKLLKIHPTQLKQKTDEDDKGDVGTLITKWEKFGDTAKLYETVDAIQEAIQIINQLENERVDGSPQLADWLLWHKTGNRDVDFTCECGKEYKLWGGFTRKQMYEIATAAQEAFGYGIELGGEDDETQEDPKKT